MNSKSQLVHFSTPEKIKTTVELENGSFDCEIIGINAYPNEHPTLSILLDDGAVFDYIHPKQLGSTRVLNDHFISPDSRLSVYKHDHLNDLLTVIICGEVYTNCKYLFSVDFIDDNANLNFIKTQDDEYYFVPNYKMVVSGKFTTRKYLKIRNTFTLPDWCNYTFRCNLGGLYISDEKPRCDHKGWLYNGRVRCLIPPIVDWKETATKIRG